MRLHRITRALIASILGIILTVVSVAPAQAHETSVFYGHSYAYVGPGHSRIVWCDGTNDSMAVRAWYYTNDWHTTRPIFDGGCGEWRTDYQITYYCLEVINFAPVCRGT